MDIDLLERLAVALGLGLLVGLQREKVRDPLAGIRTFALITLLGAVTGLLAARLSAWIVGFGLVGVAGLFVAGYLGRVPRPGTEGPPAVEDGDGKPPHAAGGPAKAHDPGLTTEVAAVLMFAVGAYVMLGDLAVGAVVGGAVVLLLQFKEPIHAFVGRLSESDLRAIMQFVLIGLVILPVLPNEDYGPWGVFNPRHIWLMVVLIVGISLGGYIAFQLLGDRVGAMLAGMLGGLISSTATTVSYARRAAASAGHVGIVVGILLLASATSLARVLVEIAAVAPDHWWRLSGPILILFGCMAVAALYLTLMSREGAGPLPPQKNPAELSSALMFGGLYAAVTLGVAAAREWLGESGMYAVAILSGLHDMDAITITSARLVGQESIAPEVGARLILTAALANTVMKTVYATALGGRALGVRLAAWNGAFLAIGLAVLFWP